MGRERCNPVDHPGERHIPASRADRQRRIARLHYLRAEEHGQDPENTRRLCHEQSPIGKGRTTRSNRRRAILEPDWLDRGPRKHFATVMKSLHIRGLDEAVVEGLKRRARRHRRSLQKEVEVLLTDAAQMVPPEGATSMSMRELLNMVSTGRQDDRWGRDELYGDDGR